MRAEVVQLTREAAENFIYREVRLLDEQRLDDWLALFTEDARYWVPTGETEDPDRETQLIYDDRPQLEDRVWQAQQPRRYAQSPRSRIVHVVSNVEVDGQEGNEATVHCSFVLFEVRKTQSMWDEQRAFTGRCSYRLRHVDGQWRIALKKIWLVNRDLPIPNLTFLI